MKIKLTDEEKLKLGIEIVAAMKASICNWDLADGRIMVLEDTFELTEDDLNKLTDISAEHLEFHNTKVVPFERDRLHKQANFAAEAVLNFLNNLTL